MGRKKRFHRERKKWSSRRRKNAIVLALNWRCLITLKTMLVSSPIPCRLNRMDDSEIRFFAREISLRENLEKTRNPRC